MQGIVGDAVSVPLVSVQVKLVGDTQCDQVTEELQLICAVAEFNSPSHDLILPLDVVDELGSMPIVNVVKASVNLQDGITEGDGDNSVNVNEDSKCVNDVSENEVYNVDNLGLNDYSSNAIDLIDEQKGDNSLAACWEQAKVGKEDFVISNGILDHKDKVEGQPVCQLCVPEGKREQVLCLAHDSVFGCHLCERKTRERIRLSFYWPGMRQGIQQYIRSRTECQLRSRPLKSDRVPITPITRADLPFQVMNIDCIGPLDPPSAQGHKYCLCIVDYCTRWPAVYALKSLTAKAVCEALIDLFTHVGVPQVLVFDCGTNFTSQLTQEMLSRMSCSQWAATFAFNGTCKNMLYHVVQQHGRQWHKFLPLMTWALREVPNATTGVSPYMLVYGRVPRSPLAVLKESWTNERDVSLQLGKQVGDYLRDLKDKLESVADL